MSRQTTIFFKLNGGSATVTAPPAMPLLRVLREGFQLTGTKNGCGEGECGACTVLVDGDAVNACLFPVCHAEGRSIFTIEAFDDGSGSIAHPLLKELMVHGAVQCGFCTPGVVMSIAGLLNNKPSPTMDLIKEALAGNLCRCTGYNSIFRAIQAAKNNFVMPAPVSGEYNCVFDETDPVDIIPLKNLDELANLGVLDTWDMRFVSGGTDLMVYKNQSDYAKTGDVWIDLSQCSEIHGVRIEESRLYIGAGTNWKELIHDPHVRQYAPALVSAARQVGSSQIRIRGTLGGNLGNASPAGDAYPPLIALGAEVKTCSPDGQHRVIPVEKLVDRPGKTCLKTGECITEISLPIGSKMVSGFFKSVPRCAQALAKVSVAIAFKIDDDTIRSPGIALGAVGKKAFRVKNAEQFVEGRSIHSPGIDDIASACIESASPVDDYRATRDYRIHMIKVGVKKIMTELTSARTA
jgi:xanthine dehydrogenase iron-sulfur cluster and FAD-binding subunit A